MPMISRAEMVAVDEVMLNLRAAVTLSLVSVAEATADIRLVTLSSILYRHGQLYAKSAGFPLGLLLSLGKRSRQ